ncbi:MAG TPA: hypothetical protein GX747_03890 [Tenericutes bacterium]|nr:hypothetical protein [Mycoplasmatota bacterium]
MRESIGGAFTLNFIAIFIILVFALLAGTLSYTKAFRVNSKIANAIEKYEGYNLLAKEEIDSVLTNYGYLSGKGKSCSTKKSGGTLVTLPDQNYEYCIYYNDEGGRYYSYGVVTYMIIELPVISGAIKIPIFSKTNRIYRF